MNSKLTIAVYSLDPWDHSLSYLRYRSPAEQLGWTVLYGRDGDLINIEIIQEADIVLIQRIFPYWFESYQNVIDTAHKYKKPIVYDIDDLLIALPPEHPYVDVYRPTIQYIIMAIIDADLVIVSSNLLAQILSPFNNYIMIWPSYLPDSIWPNLPLRKLDKDHIRIGYMGGMTHKPDLDEIAPILQKLLDKWGKRIELHFWGCIPSMELNGSISTHFLDEKINYKEFIQYFSKDRADIWLAPLKFSIFNRCKSQIKFWEYAAMGGAGVFSKIEPYEMVVKHGENGYLAQNQMDWYDIISRLINNSDLLNQATLKARHTLNNYGKMSLHLNEWERIYTTVKIKKFSETYQNISFFQQAFYRFSEELIEYSNIQKRYILQLEQKSEQLDAILESRSWRFVQRLGKLRSLLFYRSK
jgi:hypothetical protein